MSQEQNSMMYISAFNQKKAKVYVAETSLSENGSVVFKVVMEFTGSRGEYSEITVFLPSRDALTIEDNTKPKESVEQHDTITQ